MPGCQAPDLSEMEGTKDFYIIMMLLFLSMTTFLVTCWRIGDSGPKPFLLMVLFWSIYNIVPPFLFLMYACYNGAPPEPEPEPGGAVHSLSCHMRRWAALTLRPQTWHPRRQGQAVRGVLPHRPLCHLRHGHGCVAAQPARPLRHTLCFPLLSAPPCAAARRHWHRHRHLPPARPHHPQAA
jgi:hypothetical protein